MALGGIALVGVAFAATFPDGRARAAEPAGLLPSGDQGQSSVSTRRRREVDDLRRQDIAQALAEQGIVLRWQDHSLTEMTDCRDRFEAARALHAQYGVEVDWTAVSFATLIDMRLRAGKADQLREDYGIVIEWRAYTWNDLERLRLSLAAIHPAKPARPDPEVASAWDSDALAPFDASPSARPPRRAPTTLYDPDGIIEPLFASQTRRSSSQHPSRFGRLDPDEILAPSFEPLPPRTGDGDDLIDPWQAR